MELPPLVWLLWGEGVGVLQLQLLLPSKNGSAGVGRRWPCVTDTFLKLEVGVAPSWGYLSLMAQIPVSAMRALTGLLHKPATDTRLQKIILAATMTGMSQLK